MDPLSRACLLALLFVGGALCVHWLFMRNQRR